MSAVNQATAIINQIIAMQSPDDQRSVLLDLTKRYDLDAHQPTVVTDQEVSKKYGVHVNTVHTWLKNGDLRGFKEARKWYTRTDWLREFEDSKAKYKTTS